MQSLFIYFLFFMRHPIDRRFLIPVPECNGFVERPAMFDIMISPFSWFESINRKVIVYDNIGNKLEIFLRSKVTYLEAPTYE